MVLQCLGPAVPQTVLVRLKEPRDSPLRWEVVQSHQEVARLVAGMAWPRTVVNTVTSSQGDTLKVKLHLPAQLRAGDTQHKYPLLLHT